jgi:methionyl aminopeptidase
LIVRTEDERIGMRRAGRLAARILDELWRSAVPGVRLDELDAIARRMIESAGAESAPIRDYDFPGAVCLSLNDIAAHGIPSTRRLRKGELLHIDVSVARDGFYGDCGRSRIVGADGGRTRLDDLCHAAGEVLDALIPLLRPGTFVSAIGAVIEALAADHGFGVVRGLYSHGIGRKLHEEPSFPSHAESGLPSDVRLVPGQAMAVEPFLATRSVHYRTRGPFALVLPSGIRSAQREHTIIIGDVSNEILTLPLPDDAPEEVRCFTSSTSSSTSSASAAPPARGL